MVSGSLLIERTAFTGIRLIDRNPIDVDSCQWIDAYIHPRRQNGQGMTGEYPYLYHHGDFPDAGYDGPDPKIGHQEPFLAISAEKPKRTSENYCGIASGICRTNGE